MTFSLSHLGVNPFSALMTAEFKVGENLLKAKYEDRLMQKIAL